ncbi:unnamed protein product, partial [Meganyctiphanes norvegica]
MSLDQKSLATTNLHIRGYSFYKNYRQPEATASHNCRPYKTLAGPMVYFSLKKQFKGYTIDPSWYTCALHNISGLIIISNPFTPNGQLKWISTCLMKYPQFPNQTNLESHGLSLEKSSWWEQVNMSKERRKPQSTEIKILWVEVADRTNWHCEEYSESFRGDMPDDLVALCNCFSTVLGFKDYSAQAAIINYYHMDSTLAAHTDHSELYMVAPLFSYSFGQSAVFLIGGSSKNIKPSAILLRSGDVMVMSSDTRKSYHAVPRIIKTDSQPWLIQDLKNHLNTCYDLLNKDNEISENFKCCDHYCSCQNNSSCCSLSTKRDYFMRTLNKENIFKIDELEKVIFYINSILDYISNTRINMNVRQVLPPGNDRL